VTKADSRPRLPSYRVQFEKPLDSPRKRRLTQDPLLTAQAQRRVVKNTRFQDLKVDTVNDELRSRNDTAVVVRKAISLDELPKAVPREPAEPAEPVGEKASEDAIDHYDVLGVGRDASDAEIRLAYRRQALRWQRGKTQSDMRGASATGALDSSHIRRVAEAYEVLSRPERRALYDAGSTFKGQDVFGTASPYELFGQLIAGLNPVTAITGLFGTGKQG